MSVALEVKIKIALRDIMCCILQLFNRSDKSPVYPHAYASARCDKYGCKAHEKDDEHALDLRNNMLYVCDNIESALFSVPAVKYNPVYKHLQLSAKIHSAVKPVKLAQCLHLGQLGI